MLWIKEFSPKRVILTDDIKDYELTCNNDTEKFDIDILEDILSYPARVDV